MRAVVFDLSIAKYLAAKAAGRMVPALYDGALSCVSYREDEPSPDLPADDWVRLRPLMTGVCGSDLAMVYFKASPALTPFADRRFVPGHEVIATVEEVGRTVTQVKEGDRVAVDPILRCDLRGAPLCPRCQLGEYSTCERAGTGPRRGMMLGTSADLPGGFSEQMVAHESQLFVLPDSVSDARGALTEPLAVAVHAVMRSRPSPGDRVAVIGGGPIGLATIFALRMLVDEIEIASLVRTPGQAELATAMGADEAWTSGGEPVVERAARLTGASILEPELGPPFLAGGFDAIFDCAGNTESFGQSLALARGGASLVLLGAAGVLPKVDLTLLWYKELRLAGTLGYCYESLGGKRRRTFDITRELLTATDRPLEKLVTHRYGLHQFQTALRTCRDRKRADAVKVVIMP